MDKPREIHWRKKEKKERFKRGDSRDFNEFQDLSCAIKKTSCQVKRVLVDIYCEGKRCHLIQGHIKSDGGGFGRTPALKMLQQAGEK